ncbi:MAG: hypothetical protein RAO92_08375 [Candidatus Euphemobacter frigidus]|nr:hypothetical protein [Candidatus Euphemobacter frigidus]MDP8276403.1 hypothetical protein [Candidatus Euphemobacter frigidus]
MKSSGWWTIPGSPTGQLQPWWIVEGTNNGALPPDPSGHIFPARSPTPFGEDYMNIPGNNPRRAFSTPVSGLSMPRPEALIGATPPRAEARPHAVPTGV